MINLEMPVIRTSEHRQSALQNAEPRLNARNDVKDERKSVASSNPPRERNTDQFQCLVEYFHNNQILESSKQRRSKASRRGYHSGRKNQACKQTRRIPYSYLKPGALAQFRDAQRSARTVRSSIRKDILDAKSIIMNEEPIVNNENSIADRELDFSSRVFTRSYGPSCLHRKKLLAPKAALPSTSAHTIAASASSDITQHMPESFLEGLPLELLVRIVCKLQHDQIKPAFHVCKRLRQAVIIAKHCHFNYTTPGREREPQMSSHSLVLQSIQLPIFRVEADGGAARHPGTPKAPRHAPKPQATRISAAEMRQIAASLFPGSSSNGIQQAKQPCLLKPPALRSGSSNRVLFNEEELCQAIAQNSLSM